MAGDAEPDDGTEGRGASVVARPIAASRGPLRRYARLLVLALGTYAGVLVLVAMFQTRLIYFPDREYQGTPAEVGLHFEEVTLAADDGIQIAAWYIPVDAAKGTVLIAHGNAGNLSNCLPTIAIFHRMGLNVLAFDYRGFGSSEGRPTELGTYRDAEAAWSHLVTTRREPPERIVLFGRSLGGAVMIELARRRAAAALITESAFTSMADVGQWHYPLLPVRWMLRHRYESITKVPQVRCPKLFVHPRDDSIVPFAMGQALFEAAADPKELLEVPGDHNDGGFETSPAFVAKVRAFIESQLAPREERPPANPSPSQGEGPG